MSLISLKKCYITWPLKKYLWKLPGETHFGIESCRNTGIYDDVEICVILILQALVYEDGNLVAGSLEACIQHLVPTADYYPDVSIDRC